jgi:acetyl esterase
MSKSFDKAAIAAACCAFSGMAAYAQQDGSVPTKTPEAAQAKPTIGERAGQLVDKVTGDPAANADVDMRRVLAAHADLNPKPIEELSPQEARQQPTVADAVKSLLQKEDKDPAALNAKLGVTTQDATYETGGSRRRLGDREYRCV